MKISKTALAASASVAAVLMAGTAALAANFGVLGATDNAADLSVAPTIMAAAPAPTTASTTTAPASVTQTTVTVPTTTAVSTTAYQVDGIGVVTLAHTDNTLTVSAIDVNPEWEWTDDSIEPTQVMLQFTSGDTVISFLARLSQGEVTVEVLDVTPVPATSGTTPTSIDDDHDSDDSGGDDNSGSGSSNSGSGSGSGDDDSQDDPSYDD